MRRIKDNSNDSRKIRGYVNSPINPAEYWSRKKREKEAVPKWDDN